MNKKKLIKNINKELKANQDSEYKKGSERFFKEKIWSMGVRIPIVRKIGAKHWTQIKHLSKEEIFSICEQLLKIKTGEQKTIAFSWAFQIKDQYESTDFERFERWLKKHVTNWSLCDDFCTHAFGSLIYQNPTLYKHNLKWTKSKNRWEKRAAAVTLIYWVKQEDKKVLPKCFEIANKLLLDEDDLVQKGYGWALKEAANFWQKEVFDYVMKNKKKMPRTALRYAIEKMPKELKIKAMKK